MRVLVTGANGMVGGYAKATLPINARVWLTDIDTLDVRDYSAVRGLVKDTKPDWVIHLAAATDVDECERNPQLAYETNAMGTENVVRACLHYVGKLVYVSTAGVFSGTKHGPYHEYDVPNPRNVYGHSKLAGEHAVRHSGLHDYYIVRAGWMFGGGEKDKKFVGKMVRLLKGGATELKAVDDKFGSPTYGKHLMHAVAYMLESRPVPGVYHITNGGSASRFEVAQHVVAVHGGKWPCVVRPVDSTHFPLPAPRVRNEALVSLKHKLIPQPAHWCNALEQYFKDEPWLRE